MFFKLRRIVIAVHIFLWIAVCLSHQTFAIKLRSVQIKIPPQCHLSVNPNVKVVLEKDGGHRLYFSDKTVFPLTLKITDLFGATVESVIHDPSEFKDLDISEGILHQPLANSLTIHQIPKLCPRTKLIKNHSKFSLIYEAGKDILNERPNGQLFDPDFVKSRNQKEILKNFDTKNVLIVKRVKMSYDYEDSTILDYQGPHPLTKKPHLVYEGEGGFYANFHYAVVPYDKKILSLNRQELLNLAQGKLSNIDKESLTPKYRAHSFLPGPYLSKNTVYSMCEWGDTAFQAPVQELSYHDLKIWDWDLIKKMNLEKVILIVWEGDEEDWLIADGLLDPFYLTDDIVGTFVIDRKDTLKPLVLKNQSGNFELEVMTQI